MDGFETARLIRAQRRSRATPIIFFTAAPSDVSIEEAYGMGAVDFLAKPFMPAVLKAKIAFFIDLHIAASRNCRPPSSRRCRTASSSRQCSKRSRMASWPAAPMAS